LYTLKSRLVNAKLKRKKRRWLKEWIYYNRALYVYNICSRECACRKYVYIHTAICGWMPAAGCKWKAKLARQTIFDWRDGTPRIVQYKYIYIKIQNTYYYIMYIRIPYYYIYVYSIYVFARIEFRTSPLNRPPSTILIYYLHKHTHTHTHTHTIQGDSPAQYAVTPIFPSNIGNELIQIPNWLIFEYSAYFKHLDFYTIYSLSSALKLRFFKSYFLQ